MVKKHLFSFYIYNIIFEIPISIIYTVLNEINSLGSFG